MFLQRRNRPKPLEKIDAIISRLPSNHPKIETLRMHAQKYQKGYNGERKYDYHIQGLPDKFTILNDITLTIFGEKVQIDSVIVTPHAIYVNEIKSIEGIVTFDTTFKQFTRKNGENIESFNYPITQVEKIQFHLLRWLQKRNLSGLPIYYFIIFSEQSTIINVKGDEDAVRKVVSYVDEIPLRLTKLEEHLQENSAGNSRLQNNIASTILRECTDFDFDVFGRFGIKKNELLPGVHCPACQLIGMVRKRQKWYCEKCGTTSKDAHRKALNDFTLLIHPEMKNTDCKNFLLLESRYVARRILTKSHLNLTKGTKIWKVRNDTLNE